MKSKRKKAKEEAQRRDGALVDELVFKYQEGDKASGEELLRRFGGHPDEPMTAIIGKYYSLLRRVRIDFKNDDTKAFISLYIADKDTRKSLKKFYQYTDVKVQAVLALESIRSQSALIADEELKQELRFILLKMAKRYKKEKKNVFFTAYVADSYKYEVYRYLKSASMNVKEPYSKPRKMIYINDETHYNEDTLIKLDERAFSTSPIQQLDDEIGNSWVRGIACGNEFRTLTPLQRLIIKLSIIDEMSDRQIAERTRLHINTVNRQKLKAIKLVREAREKPLKD